MWSTVSSVVELSGMKDKCYCDSSRLIPLMLIIGIGIVYGFLSSWVVFRGDDVAYASGLEFYQDATGHPAWRYPLAHLMNINGRLADAFNFIFLEWMPRPMLSIISGCFMAAFYWLIMRLSFRLQKVGINARLGLIAIIAFGLAWWNASLMYVIQINYLWTSTLTLFCLALLFRGPLQGPVTICIIPLYIFAAGCHEACGLPVAVALILCHKLPPVREWWADNRRRLCLAYIGGSIIPLFSPALYSRLFDNGERFAPDDPMWLVVGKSAYITLLLILVLGAVLILNRKFRSNVWGSDIPFWSLAALGSMAFCAISGVVGRSGWFTQVFALIALVRTLLLLRSGKRDVSTPPSKTGEGFSGLLKIRIINWCLSLMIISIVVFHFGELLRVQHRYYVATRDVIEEYRVHPDRPVFHHYIPFNEAPWWILNKHLGMLNPTDPVNLETERIRGSRVAATLLLLPPELRNIDISSVQLPLHLPDGIVAYNREGLTEIRHTLDSSQHPIAEIPFILSGDSLLIIRSRDLMPGER